VKAVEWLELSRGWSRLFHKVINMSVENLTVQKYFKRDSALAVLDGDFSILTLLEPR
jgi:hypothetical protein